MFMFDEDSVKRAPVLVRTTPRFRAQHITHFILEAAAHAPKAPDRHAGRRREPEHQDALRLRGVLICRVDDHLHQQINLKLTSDYDCSQAPKSA